MMETDSTLKVALILLSNQDQTTQVEKIVNRVI